MISTPTPEAPLPERDAGESLSLELRARLSDAPVLWVDGGPVLHWTPVHSRFAKPVTMPGHPPRFVFTRTPNPPEDPPIQRWLEQQRLLVVPKVRRRGELLIFWRLAVRQRAFAIDAHPRADLQRTLEQTKRLARRASRLSVAFAFFPGEPIPSWVVVDRDEPVFLGLPDHHLAPTTDPSVSLAAILAAARAKSRVHEVIAARPMLDVPRPANTARVGGGGY
jgi:hypothetical protein